MKYLNKINYYSMESEKNYEIQSVLNQVTVSLFSSIQDETEKYINSNNVKDDFSVYFKSQMPKEKKLIINVIFKITSKLNNLGQNIYFSININDKYPEELPFVRCLTNVSNNKI